MKAGRRVASVGRRPRSALAVLSFVLALLCAGVLPPVAPAAFPGAGGKIAFSTFSTASGYQVEAIEPDGTGRRVLFSGSDPAWSADGKRLAFTRGNDIYTSQADGGDPVQVTQRYCDQFSSCASSVGASWSLDRTRLAFATTSCGAHTCVTYMSVINADGTAEDEIAVDAFEPAWSPDGSKIAFANTFTGIATVTPNGGSYTQLTDSSFDTHPTWSPDGSKIAFVRYLSGSGREIYVMNADGTNQLRLTVNSVDDDDPAWSPDGSKLVYSRVENSQSDLHTMRPDGTGDVNITNSPASSEYYPDWQPVHGYARPVSATNVQLKFVPAYKPCTVPNAIHGLPLASVSCNPPQQESEFLTVGTPDSNGAAAHSQGSAGMRTICNPPAPNPLPPCTAAGDQADEQFQVSFTDVRQKTTLLDYAGELEARVSLRITDRQNGSCDGCSVAGTVTDVPFGFAVPCTTSPNDSIGSTCSVTTTADSVLPGMVKEGQRSVWQLDQFQIFDGGPDGDADTPDNTLFAVQGLLAP